MVAAGFSLRFLAAQAKAHTRQAKKKARYPKEACHPGEGRDPGKSSKMHRVMVLVNCWIPARSMQG